MDLEAMEMLFSKVDPKITEELSIILNTGDFSKIPELLTRIEDEDIRKELSVAIERFIDF